MEYMIGAGAILESGEHSSITPAALHARVDSALAARVQAAAIDFEGTTAEALRRLLVLASGWNAGRFAAGVTANLLRRGTCSLTDVLCELARATEATEVHLFAHWLPDEAICEEVRAAGVILVAHPLESIQSAALIAGQRHTRWNPERAA